MLAARSAHLLRLAHLARRFLALPPAARWRYVRALAAVARTDLALRTVGYQRSVTRAERGAPAARQATVSEIQRARQLARAVEAAARVYPLHAECLHRAVTLHRLLRHAGLPAAMRIGVRRVEGALNAHAWVELGGEVVSDPPGSVESYVPLAPASSAARPKPGQATRATYLSTSTGG